MSAEGAANSLPVPAEAIRRLASPFFEQGAAEVYVVYCCMYLYVGTKQPELCGSCKKPVTSHPTRSVEEAVALGVP